MVKIKKGDLIELDFVASFKDSGEIFDLTLEEEAKKNNIYQKDFPYKPMKAFVGSGQLLKGIESNIIGMSVNDSKEVDLKPEDAFGKRSPKLIQLISINKLREKKLNPVTGMQLDIDGRRATIRSVNGGRVILDFNHPFAGKEVHYFLKVSNLINDLKEKVNYATEIIGFKAENLTIKEKNVKFKIANKEKLGEQFIDLLKTTIKKYVPEVKEITID